MHGGEPKVTAATKVSTDSPRVHGGEPIGEIDAEWFDEPPPRVHGGEPGQVVEIPGGLALLPVCTGVNRRSTPPGSKAMPFSPCTRG